MKETKFKQTEVGMIPSDWDVAKLGELVEMSSGTTPSRFNEKNFQGNVCWLSSGELKSHYIYNTKEKISEAASSSMRLYPKGTVVIAMYGLEAEGVRGTSSILATECTISQACMAFTNLRKINNEFFYYWYAANGDEIGTRYAQGTKQQNLSPEVMKNVIIPLPPTIEEQQRIANVLSDVDTLIANLEKLIAKKKNIKQGAMQQLLTGKKRLPGFGKPWIDKRLGEGLKFQCGAPFQSTYFNKEHQGVRLIKNRDLKSDDQIYYYDGEYSYDYIVKNGNLLVGMDGDFMPCLWNKGTALLNQRVGRILTNCWSLPYLYYILIKPLLEKQDGTGATTVKHLSHRDVENMVVYMTTDIQEQTAIANVLSDMDTEISALETKLAKYRILKTGMMQQLLTGKIRLV